MRLDELDRVPRLHEPFRLTARSAIGALLCVMGVIGVSCSGSNCQTNPGGSTQEQLSTDLDSAYFLSNVSTAYIPATYADSAGYHLRVWSDTLRLKLTDSERR
jgi:hypothetical protein